MVAGSNATHDARPSLVLVGSSMAAGGAERVLSTLANGWADRLQVTLVTLASADEDFYRIDDRVRRVGLSVTGQSRGLTHAISTNMDRIRRLESVVREVRASVVISFLMQVNVVAIAAARRAGVPILISERIDPRYHKDPLIWRVMRRIAYPFADAVVAQTESVAHWLGRVVPRRRVMVIPNPVAHPDVQTIPDVEAPLADRRYLVAMGRLTEQKGFDMLLDAFARSASCRTFDLVIVGEGQDRLALERQASALGLSGRVHFIGQVADARPYLKGASLFVLSSRYEGFPNALLEGMAMGLPAVAFDCPSGVREIVRHNIDGLLVAPNQVMELSRAIDELLRDEANRKQMGLAAREVSQRFALSRVLNAWEAAMLRVAPTAWSQPVAAGVAATREIDRGRSQ